jgi:hypothetical protein
MGYLFICLQLAELRSWPKLEGGCWSPGDPWRPRSCPEPGGGSRSHRDTWRSQSCPEPGGGSRAAGTCDGPEAAPSRKTGVVVLTWSLYVGVPSPQGTNTFQSYQTRPWAVLIAMLTPWPTITYGNRRIILHPFLFPYRRSIRIWIPD